MKKKTVIKIIVIVVIVLALVLGGLFLLRYLLSRSGDENVFYTVRTETYENVIEISGTVSAAQEQTLQALSDGTVLGVFVSAGDSVKKGDTLIQLDSTEQVYNLEKHDYSMATTRISGSLKELSLMETQRLSLVQKIADRKVTATFDGIIADLDVAVGDYLEAKDTVGTLVNVDYLTAEVEVAETDVAKLVAGQKVQLEFSAYENGIVEGYVVSWPAIGEITSRGATIVKARIRIDDYPPEILPNFSFTGKIQISEPETNILVERYAIGYENKAAYVILARSGEKRAVKVQNYGSDYVKILEGLNGGEVLLQVTKPRASGWNKNQRGNSGNSRNNGGMPGGMGGGGFSGPPPGR